MPGGLKVTVALPNAGLRKVLEPAYLPCAGFGTCAEAVWNPAAGHVPRGFLGATGRLDEVRAVLVFAEPGGVYPDDHYAPDQRPEAFLAQAVAETGRIMAAGTDLFHRNLRSFLDMILPGQSFADQLRQVWLTEGRLCSVAQEIGGRRDRRCSQIYLRAQIALMPQAVVIAFGGKAQAYLSALKLDHVKAVALSPPGANHRGARSSWEMAAATVRARHG